jgi:hypothetical protein
MVGVHDVFAIEETGSEADGYGHTCNQDVCQYIHGISPVLILLTVASATRR